MKHFRTYSLAVEFYHLASALRCPKNLKDQLARASASIALNLAEGWGRSGIADRRRFFVIAFGSLRECQAILDLTQGSVTSAKEKADVLAAHLYKLIKTCGA